MLSFLMLLPTCSCSTLHQTTVTNSWKASLTLLIALTLLKPRFSTPALNPLWFVFISVSCIRLLACC
jgi:hypothetical protein